MWHIYKLDNFPVPYAAFSEKEQKLALALTTKGLAKLVYPMHERVNPTDPATIADLKRQMTVETGPLDCVGLFSFNPPSEYSAIGGSYSGAARSGQIAMGDSYARQGLVIDNQHGDIKSLPIGVFRNKRLGWMEKRRFIKGYEEELFFYVNNRKAIDAITHAGKRRPRFEGLRDMLRGLE